MAALLYNKLTFGLFQNKEMADEIERGVAREHYGSPSFDGHVSSVQWSMKKVFVCLFVSIGVEQRTRLLVSPNLMSKVNSIQPSSYCLHAI